MKQIFLVFAIAFCMAACSQSTTQKLENKPGNTEREVGGPCEGCEAVFESPMPFEKLNWIDTLPDFNTSGPKLEISGRVFKKDGKTPAANVIIYVYHTDGNGIYPMKGDEKGWAKRHGYLRGWMKTDENGNYRFLTLRPASYPSSNNPAHIHIFIKEPGIFPYWIDDYVFSDDPFLKQQGNEREPRGGNGVLTPIIKNGIMNAQRDIYLGKNIPGY